MLRKAGILLPVLLGAVCMAQPLAAQSGTEWTVEGELGASVFFGNRNQSILTSRAKMERAKSGYEFSIKGDFAYGEATDESGNAFVNKRSWSVGGNVDYTPFSRVNPFIF